MKKQREAVFKIKTLEDLNAVYVKVSNSIRDMEGSWRAEVSDVRPLAEEIGFNLFVKITEV